MRSLLLGSVATGALAVSAAAALADCGIEEGSVRILSNDFTALHVVAQRAEECASGTVQVTKNQTTEHKTIQVPALTTNPASYTVAVVANNSIVPLLNAGLIRPLDDLVEEYGQNLQESQLIRVNGQVMAIAFMANSQHLYFRESILEEAGLEPPATYEEMLANAEVLREQGIMQNPLAANYKPGWDLAEEFVNMYMGFGGEFFVPGSAELAIQNEQGVAALEMMKALSEFMHPDFVTYDTNAVKPIWEAGEVAMMGTGWGSRAGAFIDPAEGFPEVAADTAFARAPTVGGGEIPASTLWWDGFTIAKNISDEDAEASFRAMVHGISPELLEDPTAAAAAVWLIPGYEPTPAAVGVVANLEAGTKPYPMVPYMGLLHTALGDNLAEFMQGEESAEQALEDVTQAYNTAARESGFLN
jgi:ABC-type glycerol-3-phosphate transport system substrate-binding protein